MRVRSLIALVLVIFYVNSSLAQTTVASEKWVENKLKFMSLDEKLGQLFMVAAYSNRDSSHIHKIDKLVHDYYIGGLIFFQGDPVAQANLTNRYQEKSKIPLFIAMDA